MKQNATLWVGWGFTLLTALFLLMDAGMKVAGARASIDATGALGFGSETTRILGLILLVCTLLYMYPRTSVLGAALLTGYLGGAIAVHLNTRAPCSRTSCSDSMSACFCGAAFSFGLLHFAASFCGAHWSNPEWARPQGETRRQPDAVDLS